MHKKFLSKKFIFFAALIVLLVTLKLCTRRKYTEFPKIKNGRYLGKIVVKKNQYDFFLQKDPLGASVAVIAPGSAVERVGLSTNLNLKIPNSEHTDQVVSLLGEKLEQQYQGEVFLKNKSIGSWNLKRKGSNKQIQKAYINQELSEDLKKFYLLRSQLKSTKEEIDRLNIRISSYKEALPKEEKLHETAVTEADDLTYNIEEKQKIRRKIIKEIKDKLTNLEQLQRISALGRVIDLARRTTKREDRWYLANWGEEALESQQQVADSLGLDLSKLDEKLKLAEEYLNLKNSISIEARKIEELRTAKPKAAVNQEQEQQTREKQQEKQKQDSIWNKIGDLFSL